MKTTFTTVKPCVGREDLASVHVDKNLSSPSGFTSDVSNLHVLIFKKNLGDYGLSIFSVL